MPNDGPAEYRLVRNPYAAADDQSDSAEFIAEAQQRLADLAAPTSPRLPVLEIGDVVTWSQNDQFQAYGQVLEIDKGQAVLTLRQLDLMGDGTLSPTPKKATLDLKLPDLKVRRTNRRLAGIPQDETETKVSMQIPEQGSDADFAMALAATRGEAPPGYVPPWERDAEQRDDRQRVADLAAAKELGLEFWEDE